MKPIILKMADLPDTTGLGYFQRCLEGVYNDADIVYSLPSDNEDCLIIVPRFFFTPDPNVHPHQRLLSEIMRAKGYIIQSVIWDFHLTTQILPLLGKAHLFHASSNFIKDVLHPYPTVVIPLPIKEIFKPRGAHKRSRIVGGVMSPHPRKNWDGWIKLTECLREHGYKVRLVVDADPKKFEPYQKFADAGAELIYGLTEDEMKEFYYSLDWFVSLSVGEGYSLPVREALACGVPVIAGSHTAFLDLKGKSGVFLVKVRPVSGEHFHVPNTFVYEPSLDDVIDIILGVQDTPSVDTTVPRWDDWCKAWNDIRARAEHERPHRPTIYVREKPAVFVLYNTPVGGGLNSSAKLWAKRTGSETILYPHVPEGVDAPIIVPYHETLPNVYLPHVFFSWLYKLKETNQPIVIWMHHALIPNASSSFVLPQVATVFAYTHPHAAAAFNALYLPLPIGEERNESEPQGDYFLVWGFNPFLWHAVISIAKALNLKYKIITMAHISWHKDIVAHALGFYMRDENVFIHHLITDEELEKELDRAAGYILYDGGGQNFEISARLPTVLRKNKPIIANYNPRTQLYADMVTLFPLNDLEPQSIYNFALEVRKYGIENLKPRNVPPISEEIKNFMSLIEHVRRLRVRT